MIEQMPSMRLRQALVFLFGIFAGAMIVLALVVALSGPGMSRAFSPQPQARDVPPFEPQPLPSEWRWSPPDAEYDHMFRRK